MEKISLKPIVTELLYKNDEVNTHFDAVSYTPANMHEKSLGSLHLVGQIKYDESEDLGYVINLVSSLAKREYYSESSIRSQDPKKAFENTLRKLNEVLQDFFKNKNFDLNLGLLSIAGDQLYISKLGKFKVGLARAGEHIDVLNNISLFHKAAENEERFSNIISGKLHSGDKVFAFYPARAITSREKMIKDTLSNGSQKEFIEKLDALAEGASNFSCCGLHISLDEVKEIPIESLPAATLAGEIYDNQSQPVATRNSAPLQDENVKVMAAEMSVAKKSDIFSYFTGLASKLRGIQRLPAHSKFRSFVTIALIVLIPLFTIAAFRSKGGNSGAKQVYREAVEKVRIIQMKISENNAMEARDLINQTLAQIAPYNNADLDIIAKELQTSLDLVDKVSSVVPAFFGTILPEQFETLKNSTVLEFSEGVPSVWHNGLEIISVKGKNYTLKDPASATGAATYQDNLYVLSGDNIYKYQDAVSGGTKRSLWGAVTDSLQSIAIDGNVFGLTRDGKIVVYFKAEKQSEFTLNIPFDENTQIITAKDVKFIYVFDPTRSKLLAIDKTNGNLELSYKLETVGQVKNIAVGNDGNVWILSVDGKVYSIAVQP